jgi:hypothetical protein
MIIPTLTVVVGSLLALGDATTVSEKVDAVRAKALGGKCMHLNPFLFSHPFRSHYSFSHISSFR